MEETQDELFDMTTLYAYSDSSEAETRATWRGFLSFVFGHLAELDTETADQVLSSTIVDAPEKLMPQDDPVKNQLHVFSAEMAMMFGMEAEFGLAALADFNPPTRSFRLSSKTARMTQEGMITLWLSRFQEMQQESGFQAFLGQWKESFVDLIQTDDVDDEGDFEMTEGEVEETDDEELVPFEREAV